MQEAMADQKQHRFSKVIVVSVLLTIIIYVAVVLYFSWHGKHVPPEVTYTFVPGMFAQLGFLATITRKGKDVEIAKIEVLKQNGAMQ
jgi:flagellar basal body-associated protein FliL